MRYSHPTIAIVGITALMCAGLAACSTPQVDAYRRAEKLRESGQVKASIAEYDKAISLDPVSPRFHEARSNAYLQLREYDRALDDINKSIELNPDCHECYVIRATIWTIKKDYQKAIDDYGKVIQSSRFAPAMYAFRGLIYACKNEYQKALDDLSKALSIAPDHPGAGAWYYTRGQVYERIGKNALAQEDWQKAKKLGYQTPVEQPEIAGLSFPLPWVSHSAVHSDR